MVVGFKGSGSGFLMRGITEIDLFASQSNYKLPDWFSWGRESVALVWNAFSIVWKGFSVCIPSDSFDKECNSQAKQQYKGNDFHSSLMASEPVGFRSYSNY